MDGQKLKYDIAYDSWVLEPIQVHKKFPISDHRHSSATSTPHSQFYATPQRRSFSLSHENSRLWKSLRRYWNCFKPSTDSNRNHYNPDCYNSPRATRTPKKEKANVESRSDKINSLTTYCYNAMSSEERDENLKAVVLYCKANSS